MEELSRGATAKQAQIERSSPQRPDEDLLRRLMRIKRAIRRTTSGGVHELAVEHDADIVVLRGRCSSFYCKQIAQTAAMSYLDDGEHLQNEIEVTATPR